MSSSGKPPPQKFTEQIMPGSQQRMKKNDLVTDGTKACWRNDLGEKVEGNIWTTAANGKPTPDTTCLAATGSGFATNMRPRAVGLVISSDYQSSNFF